MRSAEPRGTQLKKTPKHSPHQREPKYLGSTTRCLAGRTSRPIAHAQKCTGPSRALSLVLLVAWARALCSWMLQEDELLIRISGDLRLTNSFPASFPVSWP
jgi:hypothetical protein